MIQVLARLDYDNTLYQLNTIPYKLFQVKIHRQYPSSPFLVNMSSMYGIA